MKTALKITLYLILSAAVIFFGIRFLNQYRQVTAVKQEAEEPAEPASSGTNTSTTQPKTTQEEGGDTNTTASAEDESSSDTNTVASAEGGKDNGAGETGEKKEATKNSNEPKKNKEAGSMLGSLGSFVGTLILLGILIAYDVSRYLGSKSEDLLFNDNADNSNPEYEIAETAWANGDHLEAIRLMREYLNRNPREQYVALRIAEIYEKDLNNPLAAALEYEEVLKKKLSAERWGWAAIHLANLYSGKLNKLDEAVALLRRIDSEYGNTSAANKARERLSRMETGEA